MLITFEGVDGSGKSTQAGMLADRLGARLVREPGGTEAAERVRAILADPDIPLEPIAELLLFCAARADLVGHLIEPELARGGDVICDRFTDSTLAYQGAARGMDPQLVTELNRIATGGLRPAMTFLLRLDPEIALARAGGEDRFEAEGVAFQRQVAAAYDAIAAAEPERVAVIDAAGDPESIHTEVLSRLETEFGSPLPGGAP